MSWLKFGNSRRWIVFSACCIRLYLIGGSFKANGVILDELVVKLNSNHVLVAWAFALQNGLYYLIAPLTHELMQHFSHRQLGVTGGFLVGFSYVLTGLYANEIWHIFATYCLSGIGFGLQALPSYLCLKEHFPQSFPTISSAVSLFRFIGMASLPFVLNMLKVEYGLENSLIILGGVMFNLIPFGYGTTNPEKTNMELMDENISVEDEVTNPNLEKETSESGKLIFLEKWCPLFLPFYHHINFIYLVIFSSASMYIYTSWFIFLVSLGTSLGLPNGQAVFLSAVGGVGGFLGRLLGIVLFYFNKVNIQVCCYPFLSVALSMLAVIFMKKYFMIAASTFISGLSLGLSSATLYGIAPVMLCKYHFPFATSTLMLIEGFAIQLSGLFSGFLHDTLGSARYVFAFNAVLCLIVMPFMIPWTCNEQTVKNCRSRNT